MRREHIDKERSWQCIRGLHVVKAKDMVRLYQHLNDMVTAEYYDRVVYEGSFTMTYDEWAEVCAWMDLRNKTIEPLIDVVAFIREKEQKIREEYPLNVFISFVHEGRGYVLKHRVTEEDYWWSEQGFDIHFDEDYGHICVYPQGNYSILIHKISLNDACSKD